MSKNTNTMVVRPNGTAPGREMPTQPDSVTHTSVTELLPYMHVHIGCTHPLTSRSAERLAKRSLLADAQL